MNIEQGPFCSTGIENRERVAALAVCCERLLQQVEKLTQDIADMRVREAWRAGAFAAIGALVGGSMSNVLSLFGK